jgi:hypothetical protein
MGRRSRKRGGSTRPDSTRAERDVARAQPQAGARPRQRARPSSRERPAPPWGSFPLSELIILAGLVVLVWGLFSGRDGGGERVAGGLVLASLGGGELALREHLAGYRSHSTLLAGVAAFVAVTTVALAFSPVKLWLVCVVGVGVFGAMLYLMRELFRRRSGGLGFR